MNCFINGVILSNDIDIWSVICRRGGPSETLPVLDVSDKLGNNKAVLRFRREVVGLVGHGNGKDDGKITVKFEILDEKRFFSKRRNIVFILFY